MEYSKVGKYYEVFSGYAFKSQDLKETADIPIIKIGNISNGRNVINENMQFVSKELLGINKKYYVNRGDVLLSLTGSHMNQPNSVVGRSCRNYSDRLYLLNQRAGKIVPKNNASLSYIYYVLQTQAMKEMICCRAYGAANQVNVSPKSIMSIKWNFPSSDVQHSIASILSTYDTLIENNTKRIRLLEKMAENLYKEWFSYGKIIKGGTIVRLTDIIQITRGLSYSTAEIDCEEGLDLINLKNIQAYGGFRYDGTKKFCGKYKNEQIVCEGDLVMGVTDMTQDRRTVGSVALIPKTDKLSVISADLIKISSSISSVFLFGMFKYGNVSKYVAQFANGANVLHLRPKALHNIKVLLPNPNLINKYVDIVSPMVAEMNKLYVLSEKLARQRDLLLPRLMSGKLEVKEELLE